MSDASSLSAAAAHLAAMSLSGKQLDAVLTLAAQYLQLEDCTGEAATQICWASLVCIEYAHIDLVTTDKNARILGAALFAYATAAEGV